MNSFDKRFEEIEKKLQQPSNKNAKMEGIFKFKHKQNRVQFEFKNQILQIVQNLSSALNNDDASEANDLCDDLTAKLKRRNKLIKMPDRSTLGWDTVAEYEPDPIASDSDDGKKIRQAENRALTKQKSKKSNKGTFCFCSFGSTVNITTSHLRVSETSTSDFHQTTSPRTATFDECNGPVAPISDRGTRVLVAAK